ncbi:hypothetical protein SJAV_11210 [Sulfurisphaera javensis]|uniref:Uncharacterized protein n=1 Tax=Sulfurisphaera javensis TaxID=2049879 RepID=A0AAT9GQV2_9CREN
MRYEAFIDILSGDKRFLSSSGDVVGITEELRKLIEQNGINLITFSDFIVEYLKENQSLLTIHVTGKPFSILCPNIGVFLQIWITDAEKSTQHFLAIVNYSGNVQISISKPELFDRVIFDIMKKSIEYLDCLRVEMPFLYRFIIFELFNSFRKLSKIKFEGIVDKNIVLADYKDRGLIWEIDSTTIDYTNSISKKILSPY